MLEAALADHGQESVSETTRSRSFLTHNGFTEVSTLSTRLIIAYTNHITDTQWPVSTHTFNRFADFLTKEQRLTHHHLHDTTLGRTATRKGSLKRKSVKKQEENDGLNESDTDSQPPSKRMKSLADLESARDEKMAIPVAALSAHGNKRKIRDEEQEQDPAQGSNKRTMTTNHVTRQPAAYTPGRHNCTTKTSGPAAIDQDSSQPSQNATVDTMQHESAGSAAVPANTDLPGPPTRMIRHSKKRVHS